MPDQEPLGTGPPPLTVFTFFLTLPFAIPVPGPTQPGWLEPRTTAWEGWSPQELARVAGISAGLPADAVPGTRIAVRHVTQTLPLAPAAAFEAFTDWIEKALTAEEFALLQADTDHWQERGFEVVTTVVALSRFLPRHAHPEAKRMTFGWLLALLRRSFSDLNTLLEAVGLVSGRWDLATMPPRLLPPLVPVLVESSQPDPDGNRQGATMMLPVHDSAPVPPEVFDPDPGTLERALSLSNAANRGEAPFMLALRLLHGAEGERIAGDPVRAIIDLNTAIEVLVSVTLTEAGRLAGWNEERIAGATSSRTGLKRRVRHHLAELFGSEADLNDEHSPWSIWFRGGYMLRNRAVHEGIRPHQAEVESALEEADAVLTNLRELLAEDDRFSGLAPMLEVRIGRNSEWEDRLIPALFPWEK